MYSQFNYLVSDNKLEKSARNLFGGSGRGREGAQPRVAFRRCWGGSERGPSLLSLHRCPPRLCCLLYESHMWTKGSWKDLPRVKLECLYALVRTMRALAPGLLSGLCAQKGERKIPTQNLKKNGQGMTGEGLGDIMDRGAIRMVLLWVSSHRNCSAVSHYLRG